VRCIPPMLTRGSAATRSLPQCCLRCMRLRAGSLPPGRPGSGEHSAERQVLAAHGCACSLNAFARLLCSGVRGRGRPQLRHAAACLDLTRQPVWTLQRAAAALLRPASIWRGPLRPRFRLCSTAMQIWKFPPALAEPRQVRCFH
jgi:hypothetical protein